MRIYCLFEQSNTFRDIWRGLGYQADSYDIEGNPSVKMDLFKEINDCFENKRKTIFDDMTADDYVLAFFPCTFFETQNQLFFEGTAYQLKNKSEAEKLEIARERERMRSEFYQVCSRLFEIAYKRNLRLILENPYTFNYLLKTLPIKPKLIIQDRTKYGDFFKKPTMFYFINCEPNLFVAEYSGTKPTKTIKGTNYGIERSLISKEFARIFVEEFIIK